jgi:hypothetical protein
MSEAKLKGYSVLWWWLLSLGLGLFAGYFDSHTEEVPFTLLLLLGCGVVLGVMQPAGAWRWALLLGASVFLFHALEWLVGYQPRYPAEPNIFITLFALAPAFIGVYGGVLVRRMLEQARGGNV